MSAQLGESNAAIAGGVGPRNYFSARLVLAAGVSVSIDAPSLADLSTVVGKLQPTEAANDAAAPGKSNAQGRAAAPSKATTAAQADAPKQTAAASTPAADAAAGQSQVSTAAGEAGNAGADAPQAGSSAPTASTEKSSASVETAGGGEPVTFDQVKKAFLALAQKPNGRALCEGINKTFGVAKLSDNKPENYAAVLAEIQKAG